tara:strand:- start:276 stop:794 length:519 start_codon:yes stop_codon:yes gene_type:complete
MAGSLIKISETTVSSSVSTVTITGIDSTYNVYKLVANNVTPSADTNEIRMRFTASGTAQSTSNYDWANKRLRSSTSFTNDSDTNQTGTRALDNIGTGTGENSNAVFYLFNFSNSSEFSFATIEGSGHNGSENRMFQGGTVYTVAEAHDGVQFFNQQGNNIDSGTFTLYGLRK